MVLSGVQLLFLFFKLIIIGDQRYFVRPILICCALWLTIFFFFQYFFLWIKDLITKVLHSYIYFISFQSFLLLTPDRMIKLPYKHLKMLQVLWIIRLHRQKKSFHRGRRRKQSPGIYAYICVCVCAYIYISGKHVFVGL